MERETMSVEQASKILGVGRGLAYSMAREGKLPTIRFGRRLLVPRRALYRLLDESIGGVGEKGGQG